MDIPSRPRALTHTEPSYGKLLDDMGATIRLLRAGERYDERGVRTVWHRGRASTELLSWEHRDGRIIKQELSFMRMVVEYQHSPPSLRTGRIPLPEESTDAGNPKAHMVVLEDQTDEIVLRYASTLLKAVRDRDFYCQHLLKQVNDQLASTSFDQETTVVASLAGYLRASQTPPPREEAPRKPGPTAPNPRRRTSVNVDSVVYGTMLIFAVVALALFGWLLMP